MSLPPPRTEEILKSGKTNERYSKTDVVPPTSSEAEEPISVSDLEQSQRPAKGKGNPKQRSRKLESGKKTSSFREKAPQVRTFVTQ